MVHGNVIHKKWQSKGFHQKLCDDSMMTPNWNIESELEGGNCSGANTNTNINININTNINRNTNTNINAIDSIESVLCQVSAVEQSSRGTESRVSPAHCTHTIHCTLHTLSVIAYCTYTLLHTITHTVHTVHRPLHTVHTCAHYIHCTCFIPCVMYRIPVHILCTVYNVHHT